jgi:hypothetical protein
VRGCGDNASGSTWPESGACVVNRSGLGWSAVDGESPVGENCMPVLCCYPSSSGPVESAVNLPGPPGKPEYFLMTDSGLVP